MTSCFNGVELVVFDVFVFVFYIISDQEIVHVTRNVF